MKPSGSQAVLYVQDQQKMPDFYTEVLAFEVTDRGPIAESDALKWVEDNFRDEPGFVPSGEYYDRRKQELD